MSTTYRHKRHQNPSEYDSPGPSSSSQAKKRTRFVSPSQDPVNFETQVEESLENPSATRKGRVKTEGYESDSTDDGEGVVYSRRKGKGKEGDGEDEDVDMFAAESEKKDDEDEGGWGKKGKKKEEYMRLGDIEGQEFNTGDQDQSDSEEEDDEPVDEDEAERRKKVGMGYELSRFNMREEMEEGRFSADGMYVRTFDPHAVHDRWMDDVDERDIKKARKGMKRREKAEKEREKRDRELEDGGGGREELEKELVAMLRKGESVLEALARLGAQAKKEKA
jgi:CD2 antigen cytoplasmic tail-binding protein 2